MIAGRYAMDQGVVAEELRLTSGGYGIVRERSRGQDGNEESLMEEGRRGGGGRKGSKRMQTKEKLYKTLGGMRKIKQTTGKDQEDVTYGPET